MKIFWILLITVALLGLGVVVGCSCDDDDDDDDDGDDDVADDDTGDDDVADDDMADDDTGGDCEGYDVIIEGQTGEGDEASTWTAYLNIDVDTGDIDGKIDPDDADIDEYDITGFRHDQTTGYMEGSFPTPASIPPTVCEAETVSNRVDFTIVEGIMTEGVVTFYCGEILPENEIFVREATGEVTCGDFAM